MQQTEERQDRAATLRAQAAECRRQAADEALQQRKAILEASADRYEGLAAMEDMVAHGRLRNSSAA